ncbi:SMR family transporter, partial [Escherichia coli]
MNPYIYLGGAILAEVIGTTLMKFSEGFTRLWCFAMIAAILPYIMLN